MAENAERLAEKALTESDPVSAVFRMVLSRNPTEEETRLARSFLANQEKEQEREVRRISFRPDFPPALFNDYQKSLPASRFLRGPDTGWEYHKGKWTGGYEGWEINIYLMWSNHFFRIYNFIIFMFRYQT